MGLDQVPLAADQQLEHPTRKPFFVVFDQILDLVQLQQSQVGVGIAHFQADCLCYFAVVNSTVIL